jgi:hypothetical protein
MQIKDGVKEEIWKGDKLRNENEERDEKERKKKGRNKWEKITDR